MVFNKIINDILFVPSWKKHKKYAAIFKDPNTDEIENVHFGDSRYEHYKDKIGFYSNLDHNDEKRRDAFRKRAEKQKNKDGSFSIENINTPAYFSYNYLW